MLITLDLLSTYYNENRHESFCEDRQCVRWWKSRVKVQCSTVLQFTKDSIIEVVDTKFDIVGNSSACSSAGKVHFIGS